MRTSLLLSLIFVLPSCAAAPDPIGHAPPPQPPPPATSATATAMSAEVPPRVEKKVVVSFGRTSGFAEITTEPGGPVTTRYEVLENGRGPKVTSKRWLGADGTPEKLEATGTETMGTPVDEKFSRDAKSATWKNLSEHGTKELSSPAFYVALAPVPGEVGDLVNAARKAGGKISLLPEGEVKVTQVGEETLEKDGVKRHVTAFALTGLWLTPVVEWMDDDGSYFGHAEPWYSLVPEGWESAIPKLVAAKERIDHERELHVAKLAAHHQFPGGLALKNAKVFDVEKKRFLLEHTVVISGGKIVSVGPSKTAKIPEGAEVVDVKGASVLPGLWDMHTHNGIGDGELHLAGGVTTVRDVGNDPNFLDALKKRYDDGTAAGPHMLRAGFIEGRGEKAASSVITAETEAEAKAAVEEYAKRGYEQIKIYNSMKPELVSVLAAAAHAKGMRVSGHVPVHMRAEEAVRAGYDEINHINMLFLNFFIDHETDTRTPLRFSIVAEKAAGLDLASAPVKDFIALLLAKKTVIDPTVNVFENLFVDRMGELGPGIRPVASRLPAQIRRSYLGGGILVPEGKDQVYKDSFAACLKLLKRLHDAGVPMVAGTDSLSGFMLHRELELWAQAGIPAWDVLQGATIVPARVMKKDKTSGSIAAGKDADLIIVEGDPIQHMEDIRKTSRVIRGGVSYLPEELYRELGVTP